MQRLVSLSTRTTRLGQVVGNNFSLFKRTLATKNPEIDPQANIYKVSTDKKQQNVPDDLKGGQSPPISTGGKVWSVQHSDDVHIAPLGRVHATTFTASSSTEQTTPIHETTVYTTQGELNIADPFTTHTLKPNSTPQQSAEAQAASAFGTFAPPSKPIHETVFSPKISSTETYSSATDNFDLPTSSESTSNDTIKYETATRGKVFGGLDTSADTKKHSKENPFNLKETVHPRQAN